MPVFDNREATDILSKQLLGKSSGAYTRKPVIQIMVGLPRSGKSTYVNKHMSNCPVISADQLRYLVYGQRFWGPGEDMMWAIRKIILKMLMEQGTDIIIDETNTTVSRRKPIVEMAREYGYRIEAVVINTPKEVCIERAIDEGDEQLIPVIERMSNQFEPVDRNEVDSILIPQP